MSASEVREALETLTKELPAWLKGDQRREAVTKEIAIWEGTESDILTELRQEQQRHRELQLRLLVAESTVSKFAAGLGIDTEPLTRLLLGGRPEEGDGSKVAVLLWRLRGAVEPATAGQTERDDPAPRMPPDEPERPPVEPEWTKADSPIHWAKLWGVSPSTLKRRFKDGKIRHKKLSSKLYLIAIDDLPAIHQAKYRNVQNPPAR